MRKSLEHYYIREAEKQRSSENKLFLCFTVPLPCFTMHRTYGTHPRPPQARRRPKARLRPRDFPL